MCLYVISPVLIALIVVLVSCFDALGCGYFFFLLRMSVYETGLNRKKEWIIKETPNNVSSYVVGCCGIVFFENKKPPVHGEKRKAR